MNNKFRNSIIFQVVVISLVIGIGYFFFYNTQQNLRQQSIATGFDFLTREASFNIGESVIRFSAKDTYLRALMVGVLNTLKVSLIGIAFSIVIGTVIGISRLSTNWLVAKIAAIYIELIRNIPLLLQLFFFYSLFTELLPHPRNALNPISGVFLTNRGLYFPILGEHPVYPVIAASFILVCLVVLILHMFVLKKRWLSSESVPKAPVYLLLIFGVPLLIWIIGGSPILMDVPKLGGFNFGGGASISPEFGGLMAGLILYTSAFIAEVVRSGIQSVNKGQTEAAMAIGLGKVRILRFIVLPQAMRAIVPPLTNQMLNLTKNSSLAVGIGYPDFVSIANTSINQTGQAIEGVGLIIVLYVFFSLVTSIIMNWYNRKIILKT